MMPASPSETPSSRGSSPPGSDLDSADPGSNAWVDVQPPDASSGLQDQQRASTSSIWSVISQAARRAQPTGAEADNMPHHRALACGSGTMNLAGSLHRSDTDTLGDPAGPAASAAQTSPDARDQSNTPESAPSARHGSPHQGANSTQGPERPAWSWKTVLLIDDDDNQLGIDLQLHHCVAITLHEGDVASFGALKAKVLATLEPLARRLGHADRARYWLGSDPEAHICIGWNFCGLHAGGEHFNGYGYGLESVENWSLTHRTPLTARDHALAEWEDEEGAEASWLRENIDVASSGFGKAVLVLETGAPGDYYKGEEEMDGEDQGRMENEDEEEDMTMVPKKRAVTEKKTRSAYPVDEF